MEFSRLLTAIANFMKVFTTPNKYDEKNINQIVNSITRWTNSHKKHKLYTYKTKDVYKIEFGLAYEPEMAFEHRGIVLGKKNNLYYVVPITTYNIKTYPNVYHPIDFPSGDIRFYLLKRDEYSDFLTHDSVVKCNDIKTVSYKRFSKTKLGNIKDDDFKYILNNAHKLVFPTIDYKLNQEIQNYKYQVNELTNEIQYLKSQIYK